MIIYFVVDMIRYKRSSVNRYLVIVRGITVTPRIKGIFYTLPADESRNKTIS